MTLSTIPTRALSEQGINFRNLIINGDMSIAQRGTSQAGISTGYNTCDRWRTQQQIGAFTQSQSTDVPSGQGFATSLKMDCTTANASPGSTSQLSVHQRLEGQMLQSIKKGTPNAESLTMSFWVKSNKTGTYTAEINDDDNSRSISKSYTIDTADTWEKKTITFEGDTTGTLDNDNARSFEVLWWLDAGSDLKSGTFNTSWNSTTLANRVSSSQVSLADNTANEWYITGVQLEVGTSASDFEFLPYDVNLQRCLRYFERMKCLSGGDIVLMLGHHFATGNSYGKLTYYPKRSSPSLSIPSLSNIYYLSNGNLANPNLVQINGSGLQTAEIRVDASNQTAGGSGWLRINLSQVGFDLSAEL